MPLTQDPVGSVPMVAYSPGFFIAIAFILAGLLAVYAVWWVIFRAGKEE